VVILSDYAKGVLSSAVCRTLLDEARRRGIPTLVDPKGSDFSKYAHATALSPNRLELATATGAPVDDLDALLRAGEQLRAQLHLDFLTATLGELGIALIEPGSVQRYPALARQVFDVSGAGDTVLATLAMGLALGLRRPEVVHLANLAAGVVVGKVGTVPIRRSELLQALLTEQALDLSNKVCDRASLVQKVQRWRAQGERVVFTNGCFDLLHTGHVTYLDRARRHGQRLVVGLNTDRSVRALKGSSRPIIPEQQRATVLAALASVDAVILFDEDTPLDLIKALRPDVLAKGSDYTEERVVGAREVRSWGGEVVLVPLVEGWSTTGVLKKLVSSPPQTTRMN
jgi:D-beta-D-heptose 7-phosphate kinase/D-beta-D-heptose 1-phosphate adenosyltransferase